MLEERREKLKFISEKMGLCFSKSKIHPNFFTLISLLFSFFCFLSLVKNNLILAIIFFLLASFSDFIDGAVARASQKATKLGAYLDTICDRYVEGVVFLGFLFLPLPDFLFPASIWVFLCLFGSLMTTYSKAAAKEKEVIKKELKKGLFGRPERMILIFFSMILGIFNLSWLVYPLVIFAILSNFTVLQRIFFSLKSSQT
ncbi:CDP-alcohol phosphatidyltransferase family protein [Patescibacteria group bacterium]|nr:CDP-alcohol phosphatidyltransferase family protein [Patescibacteria group bacterium]